MDKPLTLKSARTLELKYNLPISRTSRFWEGLKEGKIYATKCKKCGRLVFPPVADCGECGSSDVEWVELDGEGEVVSFTEVVVKPASFRDEGSYIVCIGRLKEGVKVLAWLVGVDRMDVKVGLKVKLVAREASEGNASFEFVPV